MGDEKIYFPGYLSFYRRDNLLSWALLHFSLYTSLPERNSTLMKRKFKKGTKVKINTNNVLIQLSKYGSWIPNDLLLPMIKNYFVHLEIESGLTGKIIDSSYGTFDGYFQVKIQIVDKINLIIDVHQDNLERVK